MRPSSARARAPRGHCKPLPYLRPCTLSLLTAGPRAEGAGRPLSARAEKAHPQPPGREAASGLSSPCRRTKGQAAARAPLPTTLRPDDSGTTEELFRSHWCGPTLQTSTGKPATSGEGISCRPPAQSSPGLCRLPCKGWQSSHTGGQSQAWEPGCGHAPCPGFRCTRRACWGRGWPRPAADSRRRPRGSSWQRPLSGRRSDGSVSTRGFELGVPL